MNQSNTYVQRLVLAARADAKAQTAATDTRTRLKDTTIAAVQHGGISEYEAAELAGVTRVTVRQWQGKKN